jgi:hypothetical protein
VRLDEFEQAEHSPVLGYPLAPFWSVAVAAHRWTEDPRARWGRGQLYADVPGSGPLRFGEWGFDALITR